MGKTIFSKRYSYKPYNQVTRVQKWRRRCQPKINVQQRQARSVLHRDSDQLNMSVPMKGNSSNTQPESTFMQMVEPPLSKDNVKNSFVIAGENSNYF